MSGRMRKGLLAMVAAVVLILSAGWGASASSSQQHEIVGTWMVSVQLVSCTATPLSPVPRPFPSLLTFADGETMIEDTTNPAFAAGQRGTGHGVWEDEGWHRYSAKSVALINFTTPPAPTAVPPSPGFNAGTQTITQTIEFNDGPDKWTANAQIQFADATGTYRSGCATATAVRFE